jgi:hypothetical protein
LEPVWKHITAFLVSAHGIFYTYKKPLVKEMHYHGRQADYAMRVALSNFGPMRIELIRTVGR